MKQTRQPKQTIMSSWVSALINALISAANVLMSAWIIVEKASINSWMPKATEFNNVFNNARKFSSNWDMNRQQNDLKIAANPSISIWITRVIAFSNVKMPRVIVLPTDSTEKAIRFRTACKTATW